ncbi:MAG: PorV/PorQ family protein [Chitinivibrionales bacterium]|nr:PorV/PorQ family protein [Chitinivibrionales bacterium]
MHKISACLLSLWLLNFAEKIEIHPDAGTSTFPFLKINYDARSAALGNSATATKSGIYGVLNNPAMLGYTQTPQVLLGYRSIVLDIKGTPLAYSMPITVNNRHLGAVAAHAVYLSHGSLSEVDENGEETGIIWEPYSLYGGIAWSKIIWETVSIGANVKGIYDRQGSNTNEAFSASGLAFDFGAQYRLLRERLVLGISMTNLGLIMNGYQQEDTDAHLPAASSIGISYTNKVVTILAEIEKPHDNYLIGKSALEIALAQQMFFLRFGASTSTRDVYNMSRVLFGDDDETASTNYEGPSLGLGFKKDIGNVTLNVDAALYLRLQQGITPPFLISAKLEL